MISFFNKPSATDHFKTKTAENDSFNTPSLPLLGNMSTTELINKLQTTLNDEASAIEFYTHLLNDAKSPLQSEFIGEALQEEKMHFQSFTQLYQYLTESSYTPVITPTPYSNLKEGILTALKQELDAIDFYKSIILSTTNELVQQAYFYAMMDESEHATMFSTLFNNISM